MYEAYFQQQPTATWNNVRGVWETDQMSLFCGHLELYSETWQTSGMMQNGQVFELPMPERLTADSEFLSLPIPDESMLRTPSVTDSTGGARSEKQASERGQMVKTADQVVQLAFENGLKVSPAVEASLLPTPTLGHMRNYDEPVEDYLERRDKAESGEYRGMPGISLGVAVRMNWGKFEPAIKRWEQTLNRQAPTPTKPDGKDGAHRLSSKFTEWMMGLPDGWITNVGLTRNEELKACGNGVVPQQAKLALEMIDPQ